MALPAKYRIVPTIGVARLGNAPADEFFVGPETPGRPPEGEPKAGTTVPPFKDGAGRIKPQAARFRIWEYLDNGKGKYEPKREINADTSGVVSIEWSVHLANKKASFFTFDGLVGDVLLGPSGLPPKRRNVAVPGPIAATRKTLWLDPGERKISGRNTKGVEFRKGTAPSGVHEFWPVPPPSPPIEYLGELRTDDAGRLLVIGGKGDTSRVPPPGSKDIDDYANNDGWFDDASDGPVTAKITFKGKPTPLEASPAWVLCGPPDFAPYAQHIVTLYDVLYDMAARLLVLPAAEVEYDTPLTALRELNREMKVAGRTSLATYKPSFTDEIWPILRRAIAAVFLFKPAQKEHATLGAGPGNLSAVWPFLADPLQNPAIRQVVFNKLHKPGTAMVSGTTQDMPKLLGDDPYPPFTRPELARLTLTRTQYAVLEQWSKGKFVAGPPSPPAAYPPVSISPAGLTRAALEACAGGAFYPGIEVGWQIRNPSLFGEPFRIDHGATSKYLADSSGIISAGHFTRQMAVPWQADFLQCKHEGAIPNQWGWWPGQRPDHVYASRSDATAQNPMVDWHRATVSGAPALWAEGFKDPGGVAVDHTTPSYKEMLANWRSFAFVVEAGPIEFEGASGRPPDVP
ncbi:MAG: LodA/GoxA family CTQ-dependent oxidase [Chloroflexota bacterium]